MKAEFAKVNAGVLPWQERSARFLDLALSLRIGRGRPCGNPHLYSVQTRIAGAVQPAPHQSRQCRI